MEFDLNLHFPLRRLLRSSLHIMNATRLTCCSFCEVNADGPHRASICPVSGLPLRFHLYVIADDNPFLNIFSKSFSSKTLPRHVCASPSRCASRYLHTFEFSMTATWIQSISNFSVFLLNTLRLSHLCLHGVLFFRFRTVCEMLHTICNSWRISR